MKSYKDYQQMMAHLMRQGYNKGGYVRSKVRRPITTEEDKAAKLMYGKSMEELSIGKRTEVRDRIKKKKVDPVTFQEYLDDFKKMAADPDYKPKFVKPLKGVGSSAQRDRARAEAKKTIEGFESKFLKNVAKRKRIKMKAAMEADPERKQREMAKKAERRRQRRVAKLSDKVNLTQREKLLNFEQSLITRQLNDKIKANPNIILKNEKLLDKLSTTVDSEGNIIKSKPTIYELEKRGLFEIEHQRDVRKAGAMKDFPYNRNPILGPHNRSGGFKDMAEKFIEKNPDPKNPKVKNIIKKAEELKITLQPNVPKGTFETKGLGYKQPTNPTGKFVSYAESYLPELVDDKIGMAGYTKDRKMLEQGLKATRKIGSSGPTLGANLGLLKGVGETLKAIPTPTGAVALNLAFQPDLSSGIDRAALGAEAAFAPELVRQTSRLSSAPIVQRFFNLGLSPQLAVRAARIASPIGIATLAGEGIYQLGRLGLEQQRRMQEMTPEQRRLFDAEQQSISEFSAAGGGIAKLAGKRSGPAPESGPTPQGLDFLMKRGR
tara:strand:- start:291 stop:1931 length:1641 start_codon:yes stop_codon:yes gene_type:complete